MPWRLTVEQRCVQLAPCQSTQGSIMAFQQGFKTAWSLTVYWKISEGHTQLSFWDPDRQLRGLPGTGRLVAAVLAATVHKDGVGCLHHKFIWWGAGAFSLPHHAATLTLSLQLSLLLSSTWVTSIFTYLNSTYFSVHKTFAASIPSH